MKGASVVGDWFDTLSIRHADSRMWIELRIVSFFILTVEQSQSNVLVNTSASCFAFSYSVSVYVFGICVCVCCILSYRHNNARVYIIKYTHESFDSNHIQTIRLLLEKQANTRTQALNWFRVSCRLNSHFAFDSPCIAHQTRMRRTERM